MWTFEKQSHVAPAGKKISEAPFSSAEGWSLVRTVLKVDTEGIFKFPVNASTLKNYDEIIFEPMDLSTIACKIYLGHYFSRRQVIQDIEIMCINCAVYNGPDEYYVPTAKRVLDAVFDRASVTSAECLLTNIVLRRAQSSSISYCGEAHCGWGLPLSTILSKELSSLSPNDVWSLFHHCAALGASSSDANVKKESMLAIQSLCHIIRETEAFMGLPSTVQSRGAKIIDELILMDNGNLVSFPDLSRDDLGGPCLWMIRCAFTSNNLPDVARIREQLENIADHAVSTYGPESARASRATKVIGVFNSLAKTL